MGGGNKPYHSFKGTINIPEDRIGDWPEIKDELLKMFKEPWVQWYCLKHEIGENGKLHIHFVVIIKILGTRTPAFSGAKCVGNFVTMFKTRCEVLKGAVGEFRKPAWLMTPMPDTKWLHEYLWKEGDIVYTNMPGDLAELQPYLANVGVFCKAADPTMDRYKTLMIQAGLTKDATFQEVCIWLKEAQFKNDKIKCCLDESKELAMAKKCHQYLTAKVELSKGMKREIACDDFKLSEQPDVISDKYGMKWRNGNMIF